MNFLPKVFFAFLFISLIPAFLYSEIAVKIKEAPNIPDYRYFKSNMELTKPLKYKNILPIEYVIDPLIMYASLWGCVSLSAPFWNDPMSFSFIKSSEEFVERMKVEPFVNGRIDSITKPLTDINGQNVTDSSGNIIQTFRGEIYAKNIIEPAYFTTLALYMRSKNYHPAIMITEIFCLSLLYEFTIRPFFLNANFEQMIKNPSVAIVFGVLLDEISTFLLTTPYIGLHAIAYILNPFNAIPNSKIKPLLFLQPYKNAMSIEALIKL